MSHFNSESHICITDKDLWDLILGEKWNNIWDCLKIVLKFKRVIDMYILKPFQFSVSCQITIEIIYVVVVHTYFANQKIKKNAGALACLLAVYPPHQHSCTEDCLLPLL